MNEDSIKEYGQLIAKKSERLVTAVYLVTDLITDMDPIKHSLRKNSVSLLSSMSALSQFDVKDRLTELKLSLKAVTEMTSLLQVAITSGIVSEMNGQILMNGFRTLQLILEKKQPILTKEMLNVDNEEKLHGEGFSSAIISTSYDALTPLNLARLHDSEKDLKRSYEAIRHSQLLSKLENKNSSTIYPNKKGQEAQNKGHERQKAEESVRSTLIEHSNRPNPSSTSSFQMKKQSRREQILSLFVKGVDVSIKDIAVRVRGCSEKTIQRELNALLYDGIIERIGEKRWSRYLLR